MKRKLKNKSYRRFLSVARILYLPYPRRVRHRAFATLQIRTFGDNFAHARVKGHDFENGEYLNSK